MKAKISRLVAKYATAFLNVNSSSVSQDSIWNVKKAYLFLRNNRALFLSINSSSVSQKDKQKAINMFIKKFNLPEQFATLIELLFKHGRPKLIEEVLKYIYLLYPTYTDSLLFDFVSATELNAEEQKKLESFIKAQTGKKVMFDVVLDESLIAGVRLQSRDLLWECSVKSRLNRLKALVVRG